MKNKTTKMLTINALLMAIIIVMSLVPFLGFITVGPIAITVVHIPVLIGAMLYGYKTGLLLSLTFGLCSMFVAMTRSVGIADAAFINPLVSVLPRLIFGFVIVFIYRFFKKTISNSLLQIGLTAFFSTLVHSFVTLSCLFIALNLDNAHWLIQTIQAFFVANIFVEAGVAVAICVPVVKALTKAKITE